MSSERFYKVLFLVSTVALGACGSQGMHPLFSKAKIETSSPADEFIFTVLDKQMVETQDMVTHFAAGGIVYADRFELRSTGVVRLAENDGSLQDPLGVLQGFALCDMDTCTFNVSVEGEKCEEISLPKQSEYKISCGYIGTLHLISRQSLSLTERPAPRRPNAGYEFMPLGSLTLRQEQVLPRISEDHPLVFSIGDSLRENQQFLADLQLAFDYWNGAIGFKALSYDLNSTPSKDFVPTTSIIAMDHCEPCGGEARALYYADPVSGLLVSAKVDIYSEFFGTSRSYQQNTLAHEIGHVLGLGHNFAASEDIEGRETQGSTSVMDYGDPVSIDKALPYDQAAINWIYRGQPSERQFKHCSDREVLYKLACDNTDTADSRQISNKSIAQSYLALLDTDPNFLMNEIYEDDLEENLASVMGLYSSNDMSWGIEYLDLLNNHLGQIFVNAYKIAAFDKTSASTETQNEWLKVVQRTLNDDRISHREPQNKFLEFTETIFRETPINTDTIQSFISEYNEKVTDSRDSQLQTHGSN